jgi:hypothetical protein
MIISSIVGARFRPPAAGVLSVLPGSASLLVRREPSNPYDPNALQVLVPAEVLAALPQPQLLAAVEGFGFTLGEAGPGQLVTNDYARSPLETPLHLGYVPRVEAATLAGAFDKAGVREVPGELTFAADGAPRVRFTAPGSGPV